MVKVLAAVVLHLASHNGDTSIVDFPNVKRALPPTNDQTPEDTVTLAVGMNAGIYYTIWEIGELADYPSDIINGTPISQNKEPDDLLKVK
jgi:hypothetical protein